MLDVDSSRSAVVVRKTALSWESSCSATTGTGGWLAGWLAGD